MPLYMNTCNSSSSSEHCWPFEHRHLHEWQQQAFLPRLTKVHYYGLTLPPVQHSILGTSTPNEFLGQLAAMRSAAAQLCCAYGMPVAVRLCIHLGLAKNVDWHNISTSLHGHLHKSLALGQVNPFFFPEHGHGERKQLCSMTTGR